jgi:benzoyl-CoA-dihydrodiol lyase
MLRGSSHAWKVNFCKFTNETRLAIEDASANSGLKFLAALNGICAGGGYELALACDEILLVDDGNSAVSLPETPLLAVLPGTGGLTRVVDKRKVRRDLADVFGTVAEGVKGRRAVEWRLVDAVTRRVNSRRRARRAAELAVSAASQRLGIRLGPLNRR